ncbi:MAG TPA: alpha/beta hydrolase [Rhizomicrobium sp.]|jgi:pimeloyl-ACP methyl ester carboxylesterase|nr:alpha/beta hydrolase [Rhizomicrobium sp.]
MPQIRANGLDIEYDSFGRDADPAVLLIMGFSAQMTMWPRAFCEGLAGTGFRVIRFDNRDIGLSTHLSHLGVPNMQEAMAKRFSGQPVEAPYLLEDMAADAAGVLDALNVERAHIVGASMGGMIAQEFAARYPQKTKSLVSIMSTTGRQDLPQGKPEALAAITMPPASNSREDRIAAGMQVWRVIGSPGYPATEDELRAIVEDAMDRAPYDPAGIARQMVAIMASPARNDILKNVRCPALVLHGADDPLVPLEGGKDTAASIAGCQLVVVPGMAHDFTNALVPVYLKHVGGFVSAVEARAA